MIRVFLVRRLFLDLISISISPPLSLSLSLWLSSCLSVCLICLSSRLWLTLSPSLFFFFVSLSLSLSLTVCLSVSLSLSSSLFDCLYICLSVSVSPIYDWTPLSLSLSLSFLSYFNRHVAFIMLHALPILWPSASLASVSMCAVGWTDPRQDFERERNN